ncbi:MAG TPA: hypothetical protein DCZ30_00065, partial [Clostridiales bacterium]|nr:hypothetical protein [Clostridiales bacterium]
MRKKNSLKNMIGSVLSNVLTIIVGVIAQAVFLKNLGTEFLGLNGLFTNIISMLAIVELGIGNAIIYNLYKPLANNNIEAIKSLMAFYKKSYRIIASLVSIIGIAIIPFLSYFVETVEVSVNINLIYLLFLIEVVCSYLLSYKRSILFADQKNYIINYIHIGYTIVLNILQILILIITKNYYLYLIIKIIMRILENIIITLYVNKKYDYLKDDDCAKLNNDTEKDIFKKVKALFFHKVGTFIINGTDNLIISKMISLAVVGLYSNYYMIINAVQTVFKQIIQATTASVGNLLITEDKNKCFDIFKKIRFLNFWVACFSSISVLIVMDSFIIIWLGKEYILPEIVLFALVFNLYQKLMRNVYMSFKEAAGIFHEDRFIPIIEAILNIFFSIVLCRIIGLAGVFLGTIISGLCLWCY